MNKRGKLRGVVMFMAMFMMASVLFSCNDAKEKKNEKDEEKDKDKKEQTETGKITPEFKEKIQQYDYLTSFSDGYAVVGRKMHDSTGNFRHVYTYIDMKGNEIPQCQYQNATDFSDGMAAVLQDGKWGYINAKGKVIIPFVYECAGRFSEGLAAVYKDDCNYYINKKGEEVICIPGEKYDKTLGTFSDGLAVVSRMNYDDLCVDFDVINKVGEKVFSGKGNADYPQYINYMDYIRRPEYGDMEWSFSNGELYIPNERFSFNVYNKQGEMLRIEENFPNENFEIITKNETIGDNNIVRYGMSFIGEDNANKSIPAIYDEIEKMNNGVSLVCLYEYDENALVYGASGAGYDVERYWGYVDLDGNDTFSDEVKEKCAKSLEIAKAKYKEQNY